MPLHKDKFQALLKAPSKVWSFLFLSFLLLGLTYHRSPDMGVHNACLASRVPTASSKAGASVAASASLGGRAYALSALSLCRDTLLAMS